MSHYVKTHCPTCARWTAVYTETGLLYAHPLPKNIRKMCPAGGRRPEDVVREATEERAGQETPTLQEPTVEPEQPRELPTPAKPAAPHTRHWKPSKERAADEARREARRTAKPEDNPQRLAQGLAEGPRMRRCPLCRQRVGVSAKGTIALHPQYGQPAKRCPLSRTTVPKPTKRSGAPKPEKRVERVSRSVYATPAGLPGLGRRR